MRRWTYAITTRVVEYNDVDALERELSHGDVACVLMEPALTNIGIVLPEPGYLEAVRSLTRAAGTLLINDETHTLSAGPGGMTGDLGLQPDIVTLGKAIAGGIPIGAYGLSAEVAAAVTSRDDVDLIDTGGVGGTLAGNALSMAAARATLSSVLTDDAFVEMTALATRFTAGVQQVLDTYGLPWSVVQLGARSEYRFASPAPRTGGESNAAADPELEDYLHVALANRGVLLTPFHSMALMCPGHHRGGRGPAHRGVHQGRGRPSGVTPPDLLSNERLVVPMGLDQRGVHRQKRGQPGRARSLRGGRWLLRLRGRGPW